MSNTGHNSNSPPSRTSIRRNVSPIHSDTVHVSRPTWRVKSDENVALDESEALHRSQAKLSNTRSRRPHRNRGSPSRLNLPLGRQDSPLSNALSTSTGDPLVSMSEAGAPPGSTSEVFSLSTDRSVPLSIPSPPTPLPVLPTTSDVSAPTLSTTSSHQTPQGTSSQVNPPLTSRQAPESSSIPNTSRGALSSPAFSRTSSLTETPITPTRGTTNASAALSVTLSLTLIGTSTTTSIPALTATTTTISTTDTSPTTTPPTMTSTTFNSQTTTTTTTISGSPALTTLSTPTEGTPGQTSSTSVELTPAFTSSNITLSPPLSTGVIISTTSFDVSNTAEIPQSTTILPSTFQSTPEVSNSTIPLQLTSDSPGLAPQSATITLDIMLSHFSTSTYTKYWTTTNPGGLTVTYSTAIGTGILGTDNSHPGGRLAHNTGAIIGVALAGTFTVIISVFIIFFACKRYKQKKDIITGSRENFLSSRDGGGGAGVSAWRPPLDDDEFESGYDHRRLQSGAAVTTDDDGMTRQLPTGPISYSTYPYDGGDGGENSGGRNGGFSGDASAESAMMYPIQRQSELEYWPNATQIGLALPYQNPQELASGSGSDPFGDEHAALDAAGISRSMTGHGHQSSDALASSVFFGSSSHGHLIHDSGVGAAHSSSSGHGLGDGGRRSKNASPVEERNKFPPSSYVPPGRPRIGGSDDSVSGNASDSSSIKGLFGRLKSMSKDIMKEKKRRSRLQHQDSRGPGLSRSSGESNTSRPSMSMSLGHSSGLGHTSLTSHEHSYYGIPSSLLNPPKPMPMPMPTSHLPPVPVIRHSEPTLTAHPYLTSDAYPLRLVQDNAGHGFEPTSDSPYVDTWTPPTIFCSSPSPAPTETSSYVEGLLNPHMLPGSTGGLGIPTSGVIGGSGAGSAGSARGYGFGMSKDGGESVMSLRDNLDYSRPISGAVTHKSTTTFGTDVENASIGAEMEKRSD